MCDFIYVYNVYFSIIIIIIIIIYVYILILFMVLILLVFILFYIYMFIICYVLNIYTYYLLLCMCYLYYFWYLLLYIIVFKLLSPLGLYTFKAQIRIDPNPLAHFLFCLAQVSKNQTQNQPSPNTKSPTLADSPSLPKTLKLKPQI